MSGGEPSQYGWVQTVWGIIGIAVLLHGFFFVRYGSPHPCAAAAARVIGERPDFAMEVGVVMGLGGGSSKLILRCYAVALLGSGVLDELDDLKPKKQR